VETASVTVLVLGPCAVVVSSRGTVALTQVQRRILARLAMVAPSPVTTDQLVLAVWGDDPPRTARAALLNQISRIRTQLASDPGSSLIVTTPTGYALGATIDAADFVADVSAAEWLLESGEPAQAFEAANHALQHWRGLPFAELDHLAEAEPVRQRLHELRRSAENLRLSAALRLGRVDWAVPEAERMVADTPFDERRWLLLAEGLQLGGRRGDSLAVFDRARRTLRDGLGLDPGPALRAAEAAMLGPGGAPRGEHQTVLRGIDAQVQQVVDLAGGGRRVALVGEEGSGTSSALDEVARRLRSSGRRVTLARCVAHPAHAGDVLIELLDDLREEPDRATGYIEGFVAAVRRAVARTPGPGEVVLVIDDLHLAGPSSRAALEAVCSVEGLGMVSSAKHRPSLPFADVVVELPSLGADAVAQVAADRLGVHRPSGDPVVRWLVELSGGNPMLLECLLEDRGVAERWIDLADDGSSLPEPIPTPDGLTGSAALADVVRRRLEHLGVTTLAAVEVAAACGPEVPRLVLDVLAPASGFAAAVAAGLLITRPGDVVGFRHGAVQRVVDSDLPPGRRMEIRHAAGLMLERAGAPAVTVAPLLLSARELDPVRAVASARRAAAEATTQGGHRDAAFWCEQAIDAARELGERGTALVVAAVIAQGDALRLAGDPEHVRVLAEATELAGAMDDGGLLCEAAFALLQLGATTESGSANETAVRLAERAMELAPDTERRAEVAAAASLAYSMSGEAGRCRELFIEAETAATSPPARRRVLPFAFLGLGLPADLDHRDAVARELLELASDADDPVARFEGLHLDFSVGLQRADGPRARRALAEMEALVDRVGDIGRRWALLYQMAAVAHLDDELDRAERLSDEALAIFSPVSASRAFAVYGGQLLALRLAQGRLVELAPVLEVLVADQPGVPAWHAALALSLVDADPERARRHAGLALEQVLEDFTWTAAHVIGGRAAARVGDELMIEEYRSRLESWSGRVCWQGTCAYGPIDTTLSALARAAGDTDAAAHHLAEARRLARSLQAPVFERELETLFR
jgi:DNA-binding SARP family transcriptional activator/tetratricopeptide (TPR) repeat protein